MFKKALLTEGVDIVKTMNLSTEKLQKTGWKAKYKSQKTVELATREFLKGMQTSHD